MLRLHVSPEGSSVSLPLRLVMEHIASSGMLVSVRYSNLWSATVIDTADQCWWVLKGASGSVRIRSWSTRRLQRMLQKVRDKVMLQKAQEKARGKGIGQ